MEKSIIAVEENTRRSDTDTPVAKSLGGLIQIDSISIELNIPRLMKEEGNCQHFSLRGYVADMRIKDRKVCSPFPSASDHSISEEELPPLDAPKFRWWRCKNCIDEIGTESAAEETEIRANVASTDDATTNALSEMKHESVAKKGDRNKAIIDDSANTSGFDLLFKPYKGRGTVVEDKAVTAGNRTGSGNVRDEEIRCPTVEVAISKHCSGQEIDGTSPAANLSNNSTQVAISDSTLSGGKIVSHGNLYIRADDVSVDIGAEPAMNSPKDGQRTASTAFKQSDIPDINDKALETSKTKLSRLPSIELRDYNGTSSGSDTTLAKNRQCDSHNDIPNDLPRRKIRKVRLLTDILREPADLETSHAKAVRNSSSIPTVAPRELEPVGTSKDKKYFQKKRKMTQEVETNLSGMGIQYNIAKRVRSSNGGVERSPMAIVTADSRSDEKGSDEEGILGGNRSLGIKHRNGINKKKNKQLQPVDGYSPEMPPQDTTMQNGGSKGYGAVNGLVHSVQYSSMGGKFGPHLSSCQSLVGTDRDSDLFWRSSNFPEVGRVPSTLMLPDNNFAGESSTRRNNPVQPVHELSDDVTLDLSLNSFRDSDKHAENDIIQSKNMTNSPFILQNGNKGTDPRRKDNTLLRQSNVPESGQPTKKGVICDLNQGAPQTAPMWQEIQNSPILLQKGNLQVPELMETPHQHNKENLNEFLEHSGVIKHHRYQHSEKVLERGLSDDIPMEIVELMAKNQYERGLTETRPKCMMERTDGFARPYTEIHQSEAVTWSRPGVTSFRPAQANMNTDVGTSRGSSLQISHAKRNHLGLSQAEGPPTKLFGAFPQTQQKFPSGGQGSASVHIRPGLQRGEEAKPVWFPTVQNMPLGLGVPQKSIIQPNDKMIHGQASASLQKGRTISDIKSGDVRMQNEHHLRFPKSSNAGLNVKGMGSLDPYCNETIPAMQLLSLMDRRMPSSPPFNIDANKLLEKPFAPCSYHPRFQMDGKQSILNGSYLSHHQLKESPGVHPGGYYADQISFKSRGQEKSRKSYGPSRCGGSKLERFVSSSGLLSKTQDSFPEKAAGEKRNQGTSNSRVLPQQDRNTSKLFGLEGLGTARALPVKNNCESCLCSVNRNPAEFSVPEEGNPFTRTIKDPRIGKKSSKERSHNVDLNKRKQPRIPKERAGRLPPLGRAL
ncbi:protein EMBRYONIC FLOWER 1 [Capsicum annuum]